MHTGYIYIYIYIYTHIYIEYIQELSWTSPKCTYISYKRLICLSGWDVGSICASSLRARVSGTALPIYFPVFFSIFPGRRDPSERTYAEDRTRRRKIRASRPIPLKVSPMENCRRYWLVLAKKHTVTKARKLPVPVRILYLSFSCDFSLFGLED